MLPVSFIDSNPDTLPQKKEETKDKSVSTTQVSEQIECNNYYYLPALVGTGHLFASQNI